MGRKRTVIESPFGSRTDGSRASDPEVAANVGYLRQAIHDSLQRGEAPFASHGFYPQVLFDDIPEQRRAGMESGFAWGDVAELVAVYADRGITPGMIEGIRRYEQRGIPVETRWLYVEPER